MSEKLNYLDIPQEIFALALLVRRFFKERGITEYTIAGLRYREDDWTESTTADKD